MFNFSKNEKTIIAFLSTAFIVGSIVHYYKLNCAARSPNPAYLSEKDFKICKVININTAEEKDLIAIKGIGPVLANEIISYRENNGLFISKEEIMKVKGIGPKKYEKIKDFIALE